MKYLLEYNGFINENYLKAEKVYFKTNLLSDEDKNDILNITNKSNYTKVISDICYVFKKDTNSMYYMNRADFFNLLSKYNEQLSNYNKNVFPIKNLNDLTKYNAYEITLIFDNRKSILGMIKNFPSILIRNAIKLITYV